MPPAYKEKLYNIVVDVEEKTRSNTKNHVLPMKFPPVKCEPSPCLTLTFRALFLAPSIIANYFPTTGTPAAQSTIALHSYAASGMRTVKSTVWQAGRPTAGDGLLTHFPNALLIVIRYFGGVNHLSEPSCSSGLSCSYYYTCVLPLRIPNHIRIPTLSGFSCRTGSSGFPSSCHLFLWYNVSVATTFHILI